MPSLISHWEPALLVTVLSKWKDRFPRTSYIQVAVKYLYPFDFPFFFFIFVLQGRNESEKLDGNLKRSKMLLTHRILHRVRGKQFIIKRML